MKAFALALCASLLVGCASLGRAVPAAPIDPAKAAADAHRASVDACKAYHAAVALGAPSDKRADDACAAAQGLCAD